ncbi:hydantoinase/oxoprolinase family protein [Salipiger aestuarii]|uniref:hydantoinase/oxoprolinase family protein n=1 Tax=Salipiger aestuarii TaxID=568098 RepID=UPI001CC30D49|nr:hydantoinase/oxoprolinase family protein [Salipiger aestuarii]
MIALGFREFERLSTAMVNACPGPIMHRHISRPTPRLSDPGLPVAPHLTQSSVGVVRSEVAAQTSVRGIRPAGAGPGSIARIDSGGLVKVGPESAGADPGPACYGRGATKPTVTNIVLRLRNPRRHP